MVTQAFLHCFVLIEMFYNIVHMKRSSGLLILVLGLLISAVSFSSYGTPTQKTDYGGIELSVMDNVVIADVALKGHEVIFIDTYSQMPYTDVEVPGHSADNELPETPEYGSAVLRSQPHEDDSGYSTNTKRRTLFEHSLTHYDSVIIQKHKPSEKLLC